MNPTFCKNGILIERKFREFFVPTVLASVAAQLGTIINGIIVGNLINHHAMAGVSACLPLNQITYALAVLVSIGSSGLIAIASGKGDAKGADYIFTSVIALSLIFGITWGLVLIPNSQILSDYLSSAAELRDMMDEYLLVFVWRTPLFLMFFSWQTLIRTDGFAKIVSRGVFIAQITNVVLSFILVSGGFGVMGAGIALLCGDVFGITYTLFVYFSSKERARSFYPIYNDIKKFIRQAADIIKSGVSTASGTAFISVKIWAVYQILGHIGGADAMTLYAVCMACLSVTSMCIAGSNGAMMPIVGMVYGEKDYAGVKMLVKYVLKFALTLTGIFVAFVFVFPDVVLAVYNVPNEMTNAGEAALRLFSISLIGVTVTFLMMYYYSTIQKRTAASVLSWTEGILVVVPATYVFSQTLGLNGVWLAFILAELAGFIVMFLYAKYVCHMSGDKYRDFFLLENDDENVLYDVSLEANSKNAVKLYAEALDALKEKGVEKSASLKVGIVLEEMLVSMEQINEGRSVNIDIIIKREKDRLTVAFRDNGAPFNKTREKSAETSGINSMDMLKALSTRIQYNKAQYNRVLALNQTIIEI